MRPSLLNIKAFSNNNPLGDSERKAHRVRVLLLECLSDEILNFVPCDEAELFDSILSEQHS